MANEIDDDVFEYTNSGGLTQCISGFGRNLNSLISEEMDSAVAGDLNAKDAEEVKQSLCWHVDELVRWCRMLNRERKRLVAVEEAAAKA